MTTRVTRLAPSPTGSLHLGNARTFLINWAIARKSNWEIILRIEDLDGPRIKTGSIDQSIDLLRWMGLDWDGQPLVQSADLKPYQAAMQLLTENGCAYACDLSRQQIKAAATAPHIDEHEIRYPPQLRPADWRNHCFDRPNTNYRLVVDDDKIEVDDLFASHTIFQPGREVGDFVIWTKRQTPAYQLAVVVDDARQGVTDVIRGDDLLSSAARQMLLAKALGLQYSPRWCHVPLVLGQDGHRLAKRHGDTRLISYYQQNIRPQRIIGLLAHWCNVTSGREELTADDFRDAFDLQRLSSKPVTFTEEDESWLVAGIK